MREKKGRNGRPRSTLATQTDGRDGGKAASSALNKRKKELIFSSLVQRKRTRQGFLHYFPSLTKIQQGI
ncbi:hypothetical protein SUGI_1177030 [Cryptomeria japonica]|nr:hypothetical protein SUGI_1177030 [Cryptomeria japonica]